MANMANLTRICNLLTGNQNLEEDLKLMRYGAAKLFALADDITKEVTKQELHPAKKRKSVVHNWMMRAQDLKIRMEGVEQQVEQGVPSLSWSDHKRLRDNIINITKAIEDQLKEDGFSDGVAFLDVASSSLYLVTAEIKGRQFGENLKKIVSWLSFFAEMLGNYDDLSDDLKNIAKLVAEECAGLPLAIKVVATSMRGVFDVFDWNNTLEELKSPTRIHKGLEDEVFRSLQVSYSRLNEVKLKNCFLSCALYPEYYKFERDELVNLWILEGHFEDIPSWREKLNIAHTMLNRLVGACLLDARKDWARRDVAKMHDLIRDMAIQISMQLHNTIIKAGVQLQEVPQLQEWKEDLTKVSLVRNNIREIPLGMSPRCHNLSSLLFRDNSLETIPESLFQFLSGLKFLDLSWTDIKRVPVSVSYLENLLALSLSYCHSLTHVSSLEKLTKLRHLELTSCFKLIVLPQGMDKLVNLESLLLRGCNSLCVPFRELTTGLSNIQRLELPYGVKDPNVADIQKLRCLESFIDCRMRDRSNFNTYVQSHNFHQLNSYRLHLASHEQTLLNQLKEMGPTHDPDKTVIIESEALEGGAEHTQLPTNTQELLVLHCTFNVSSLIEAFPLSSSWASLIRLDINLCEGVEYVWAGSSCSKPALENLEKLQISASSLKGLAEERIKLPLGAFRNLKTLRMAYCHKVEKLFTPCLLNGQLRSLDEITIFRCEGLVEIFAGSELDEDANMELPKLRRLSLSKLPRLVNICKTGLQLCCKSIENVTAVECPKLTKLPLLHQVLGNEVPSAPPPRLQYI